MNAIQDLKYALVFFGALATISLSVYELDLLSTNDDLETEFTVNEGEWIFLFATPAITFI